MSVSLMARGLSHFLLTKFLSLGSVFRANRLVAHLGLLGREEEPEAAVPGCVGFFTFQNWFLHKEIGLIKHLFKNLNPG